MTSHGYKQNEISQELSMITKIFKRSCDTVLRAFSFKKIKTLMTVPLQQVHCQPRPQNILPPRLKVGENDPGIGWSHDTQNFWVL